MFERFTSESRQVLVRAEAEATRHGDGYLGTEHLLLGLLDDESVGVMLQFTGTDPERLRTAMFDITRPAPTPKQERPVFNARAKEVLELSLREALDVHDRLIRPRHILLGLLREADEVAAKALALAGVTSEAVRAFGEVRENVTGHRRPGYRERVRDIWDFRTAGALPAASPGASRIPLLARELAGGGRVSTMHYLRALMIEGNGLAARVLAELGVTSERIDEKAEELGVEGTSDEHPDDRRSRQVRIRVGDADITIEDEDVARQLQALASEGEDAIRDALRKLTED